MFDKLYNTTKASAVAAIIRIATIESIDDNMSFIEFLISSLLTIALTYPSLIYFVSNDSFSSLFISFKSTKNELIL